jgi:hypothetical protein
MKETVMDKPIVVPASPAVGTIGTILRYLLTALGTLLVTKQILPADTDIAQVVGAVLALGSMAYGTYQTLRNHQQKKTLVTAVPNSIAQVK